MNWGKDRKNRKKKSVMVPLLLTVVLFAIFFVGQALARYMTQRQYDDNQVAARDAYFTVDKLGDTLTLDQLTKTYHLYGGGEHSIEFKVQNYFDALRVTGVNTTYKITSEEVGGDTAWYLKKGGETNTTFTGSLPGGVKAADTYTLQVLGGVAADRTIKVQVQGLTPYTKTMELVFVVHPYASKVTYRVEDTPGDVYAKLIVMTNEIIPVNGLKVDWSTINGSANVLQVDTTNDYVLDTDLTLTTNNPGSGYLKSFLSTRQLNAGESIAVYFFKTDPVKDYSMGNTDAVSVDGKFVVEIKE